MDNKTRLSTIGEARVMTLLVELGYDVFIQLSGKAPFDLLIHKNGTVKRVEVKSSATRARSDNGWVIQLKRVRSNRTVNKIHKFDNTEIDVLAVYLIPINRIVLLNANSMKAACEYTLLDCFLEKNESNNIIDC